MKTIKITKADLDEHNFYKEKQIGTFNEHEDCSVEIDENLGLVRFSKGLYVNGSIVAKAGSGIKAGEGIEAGWGIKAGEGIEADWGIQAGWGIKAGEGIEAGSSIEAGWGIKAGDGIKAGSSIKAGEGIKAGWGIQAGEGIVCKLSLAFSCNLFAGTACWKKAYGADKKIVCGKLLKGTIAYGDLVETGLPEEIEAPLLKGKEVEVNIDGKKYKAIIS